MELMDLELARISLEECRALIPPAVPDSWQGAAAHACSERLARIHAYMASVERELEAARAAVTMLDDLEQQCFAG